MRVIAGKYKGRRLEAPMDDKVRPTSDKVKEALFSILMYDIEDAVFCDMFAGTGGIGIEALSRGAKKCYFIDASPASMRLIKSNAIKCKADTDSEFILGSFENALQKIDEKIDIFFLDPPYSKGIELEAVKAIAMSESLKDGGIIVIEHHKDDKLPENIEKYNKFKEKKYGRIVLSFYI